MPQFTISMTQEDKAALAEHKKALLALKQEVTKLVGKLDRLIQEAKKK